MDNYFSLCKPSPVSILFKYSGLRLLLVSGPGLFKARLTLPPGCLASGCLHWRLQWDSRYRKEAQRAGQPFPGPRPPCPWPATDSQVRSQKWPRAWSRVEASGPQVSAGKEEGAQQSFLEEGILEMTVQMEKQVSREGAGVIYREWPSTVGLGPSQA